MPRAASSVGVGRLPTPTLLAARGIADLKSGSQSRLHVYLSRIFEEKRDCSQSTRRESLVSGVVILFLGFLLVAVDIFTCCSNNVNSSQSPSHTSCLTRDRNTKAHSGLNCVWT